MKNLRKKLQKTNQFSTGDLDMMDQMHKDGNIKVLKMWIASKGTALITSRYAATLLLGHELLTIANSLSL